MVEHTVWIDQILRVQDSAAIVALVSPGRDVMAVGTFPFYKPVRKEALVVLTIRQDDVLFEDISVLVQRSIEFLNELLVDRTLRTSVIIKLNVNALMLRVKTR